MSERKNNNLLHILDYARDCGRAASPHPKLLRSILYRGQYLEGRITHIIIRPNSVHISGLQTFTVAFIMDPALNPDTPPPPPPKPSSHETSRRGTPQLNQSIPGTPQQQFQGYYQAQEGKNGENRYQSPSMGEAVHANNINSLPKPPTVEEGWLPDVVKDKSYVFVKRHFCDGIDILNINLLIL